MGIPVELDCKWSEDNEGFLVGAKMVDTTTADYSEFSEKMRARWNIWQYVKTFIGIASKHQNTGKDEPAI